MGFFDFLPNETVTQLAIQMETSTLLKFNRTCSRMNQIVYRELMKRTIIGTWHLSDSVNILDDVSIAFNANIFFVFQFGIRCGRCIISNMRIGNNGIKCTIIQLKDRNRLNELLSNLRSRYYKKTVIPQIMS